MAVFITNVGGPQGPTGATGAAGADGVDGVSVGLPYIFETGTVDANGEVGGTTTLSLHQNDRNGVLAPLASVVAGSVIQVQDETNPANYNIYTLTANLVLASSVYSATATLVSNGTIADATPVRISVSRKGATGATGSVSSATGLVLDESAAPSTGANQIAIFADTADDKLKRRLQGDGTSNVFAFLDVAQAFTKAQRVTPVTLSIASGVVTIDTTLSNYYTLQLTANVTSVVLTGLTAGTRFDLEIYQDATGGRTITGWPAALKWPGGTAPTFGDAANAESKIISILSRNGTVLKGLFNSGVFS